MKKTICLILSLITVIFAFTACSGSGVTESDVKCTVNFYDINKQLVDTKTVNMYQSVEAPTPAELPYHTFKSWSENIKVVTKTNMDVYPVYIKENLIDVISDYTENGDKITATSGDATVTVKHNRGYDRADFVLTKGADTCKLFYYRNNVSETDVIADFYTFSITGKSACNGQVFPAKLAADGTGINLNGKGNAKKAAALLLEMSALTNQALADCGLSEAITMADLGFAA